ncbi:cytochrome P450 [Nemania sp. FL0031]|nr:cytochrome P450 [Nemania sp. FL0031]
MTTIDMLWKGILITTVMIIGVNITFFIFKKRPGNLPPGPKGLPLVGNVRDLPTHGERQWQHWLKHKDIYGPISSITALGRTIVVLHSPELALELLDKRSSIYSSRPKFVLGDIVGWSNVMPLMPYGKMHRLYRKYIHMMIGTEKAALPYSRLQEKEVHRFLFRILKEPESLVDHIRTEAGAIILRIVYGYTVEPHRPDPLVQLVDTTTLQIAAGATPGSHMVEFLPALKYIPEWLPGAGWKRSVREWRATLKETCERPLKFAEQRIIHGTAEKSFVKDFHDDKGGNFTPDDYHALKWNAFTMYGAGSDTTVNTLALFFLAMTIYPAVQRQAQEEIDRIIGTS